MRDELGEAFFMVMLTVGVGLGIGIHAHSPVYGVLAFFGVWILAGAFYALVRAVL